MLQIHHHLQAAHSCGDEPIGYTRNWEKRSTACHGQVHQMGRINCQIFLLELNRDG